MQSKHIKILVASLLVLVLVAQSVVLGMTVRKVRNLERKISDTSTGQGTTDGVMTALNAVALSQPAISVSESKVYFPDMNLQIPLSKQATTLLYGSRTVGGEPAKAMTTYDITTRPLASFYGVGYQTELSCTPVRLAFEAAANPYNNHEKPSSPVKLADGRTLQIYTYSNQKCDAQWKAANVDPTAIAALFEKASSY